jgi:hypothetical protein
MLRSVPDLEDYWRISAARPRRLYCIALLLQILANVLYKDIQHFLQQFLHSVSKYRAQFMSLVVHFHVGICFVRLLPFFPVLCVSLSKQS